MKKHILNLTINRAESKNTKSMLQQIQINFSFKSISLYIFLIVIVFNIQIIKCNNLNCVKTTTRPFYLIGHMCNSIDEVKKFVFLGANSVEIDIQFTDDGLVDMIYHGIPCDCFRYCSSRENVDTMFEYLKDISTPGNPEYMSHFNFVLMDLKIKRLSDKAKSTAGIIIADKLIDILFESEQGMTKLRIVTGLELTRDYPFVYALIDRFNQRNFPALLDRIGFDVSANEQIETIEYLWKGIFENKLNIWQGDGITNCLSYIRPTQRMRELVRIRESNQTESYLAKVYHWTIDSKWTIKDSLRLSIDGMITNDVTSVLEALNDDEFKNKYHLANQEDDPFCVVRTSDLEHNKDIKNQEIIDNLIMKNYIINNNNEMMSGSSSPMPVNSDSQPISNAENDNLIRTVSLSGNDFKRNSFPEFNLRLLLPHLITLINGRRSPSLYNTNANRNLMNPSLIYRNLLRRPELPLQDRI